MKKLITLVFVMVSMLFTVPFADAKTTTENKAAAALDYSPQQRRNRQRRDDQRYNRNRRNDDRRYNNNRYRRARTYYRTRYVRYGYRTYRETYRITYLRNGRVISRLVSRTRVR